MSLTRKHRNKRSTTRKKRKVISGSPIQLSTPNKSIAPGDDFYRHINDQWLKKTKVPPTKSIFGSSEEIEKRIEHQTNALMKECVDLSEKPPSSHYLVHVQQMLGVLANSVYTANQQQINVQTAMSVIHSIQSLTSKEEVAVVMGEFLRYKVRNLLSVYGQYENKNKTLYTFSVGTGSLGLPDPSYYYKKSLYRKIHYTKYKDFVKKVGTLFQLPLLPCVIKVEKILAAVLMRTDRDTIVNERRGEELAKEFQHIPFEILFSTMGLHNWQTRIFYVDSLRWLHTLNKLYHHLGLDYWRLLLSYEFILFCLPWLPPPFTDLSFQFYRKELRGQKQQITREEQAIYVVQQFAMPFFARVYKEKILDLSIKPKIEDMVQQFLCVAEERLENVDWLEVKTRKKAQEKISKMRAIVAYPDSFEHHLIPHLHKENLVYNLLQLGQWYTEYEIRKLGQPITKRKDWDDGIFIVNAYYYGQANEIVIPSGILQFPYYDTKCSDAWNYGGLGCILCHEITHGFDKDGKDYDPDGFQKRWWTRSDNRNYNQQTKSIQKLYSKQRIFGFPVSGKRTLSENIADIGGMGIALDALEKRLNTEKLTEEERRTAYRDFFTSYATSWRYKDKPKKRIQALIVDRHAPPSLRVNLVVSQFQEWYDAFDVKPGDKLYIPPEKRIHIF